MQRSGRRAETELADLFGSKVDQELGSVHLRVRSSPCSPPTALTHYFLRRLGLAFSPWGKPDLKSSSQQGLQEHLFLPLPWGHTGYGAAWDMSQERERDLSH